MNTRTLLGALVFITAPVCLQATTSSVPLNYEYDANGNLISGDGKYYEYNDANRLVKVRHYDKTGPVIAEYFYDYNGQRVKKIEDGITTYYIGKHFEAQPDGDKLNNTSYYFANGERVAKKDSAGQLSYYHTNHLGSTSVMTDKDGKLVENTRYYPFGEIREGGKEKYSFTGKEKDRTFESYYFEARYYGSEFKHFTQADTVIPDTYNPQDFNRYTYSKNNPLRFIDPTGHKSEESEEKNNREEKVLDLLTKISYKAIKAPNSKIIPVCARGGNCKNLFERILSARYGKGYWRRAPNGAKIGPHFKNLVTLFDLYSNTSSEFSNKGYKFSDLQDAVMHLGENLKFAYENPDELNKALIEGFTSTTAIVINTVDPTGISDLKGSQLQTWIENLVSP